MKNANWIEAFQEADPLEILEQNTPGTFSFEIILRQTAALEGNIQGEPYVGSVYIALTRVSGGSEYWLMNTSRKDYQCEVCRAFIQEGEKYVRRQGDSPWTAEPYCITCAARFLLKQCEAHRYSGPFLGSGCDTHWSTKKKEWIRIKVGNRTTYRWHPPLAIPYEKLRLLNEASRYSMEMMNQEAIPGFVPQENRPWLDCLIEAAEAANGLESEQGVWAITRAIYFARTDDLTRCGEMNVGSKFAGEIHCLGCQQDITRKHVYLLYGEYDDYLCLNCAARTILVERTDWAVNYQFSFPYFWNQRWKGIDRRELEKSLRKENERLEMRLEYQKKIDQGTSIEEIAMEEGRKPATIRQRLKGLGVILPARR